MPSFPLYTLHTSSGLCVGYGLLGPSMGLALTGRRTRRSNLLPAELSLTPVTELSMLPGTHSLPPLSNSNYFGYISVNFYFCQFLFFSLFIIKYCFWLDIFS